MSRHRGMKRNESSSAQRSHRLLVPGAVVCQDRPQKGEQVRPRLTPPQRPGRGTVLPGLRWADTKQTDYLGARGSREDHLLAPWKQKTRSRWRKKEREGRKG